MVMKIYLLEKCGLSGQKNKYFLKKKLLSDEDADLSVSAQFTVFPFPFLVLFFKPATKLLSPVLLECLFW